MLEQMQENKQVTININLMQLIYQSTFKYKGSFIYVLANKEESISFGNFSVEYVSDDLEGQLLVWGIVKVTNAKEVRFL